MVRVFAFFILLGLAYLAIQVAIFVAVIVGLLQWPKETISVLIALFLLNLVGRYPIAAGIPVGIILLVAIPSSGRARGADVAIPEAGNR